MSTSHLKGFASAFQTIMSRPEEAQSTLLPPPAAPAADPSKKKLPLPSYNPLPSITDERELALAATAQRGVMKLFRAVAMHRKQSAGDPKLGIGYRKNGQRRPLKRVPEKKPQTMAGFLDLLKQQPKQE